MIKILRGRIDPVIDDRRWWIRAGRRPKNDLQVDEIRCEGLPGMWRCIFRKHFLGFRVEVMAYKAAEC